ncbi:MAG: hypothetical protein GXP32_09260 [Kiritimatiellaeota bacterium]|nr:hypothetical protein [Kiritimatiellota bacterium]
MDVLKLIFNFLFGSFVTLWNYFSSWWTNALASGLDPSPFKLVAIFLAVAFVFGSGYAAMTFAEMKFRNRGLHFIGGLILPVVYPLLFFYLVPTVDDGKPKDDMEVEKEALVEDDASDEEDTVVEDSPAIPESEFVKIDQPDDPYTGGFPEPAAPLAMNQEYFARISRLEDGSMAGPFTVKLVDGTQLKILAIVDVLPEVLSVQMEVDGEIRKVRLPYAKITNCVPD